jgi:hypothetical protein
MSSVLLGIKLALEGLGVVACQNGVACGFVSLLPRVCPLLFELPIPCLMVCNLRRHRHVCRQIIIQLGIGVVIDIGEDRNWKRRTGRHCRWCRCSSSGGDNRRGRNSRAVTWRVEIGNILPVIVFTQR